MTIRTIGGTVAGTRTSRFEHPAMRRSITALILAMNATLALAGPSVFRCEEGGKILYSDAPCIGAKVLDTTPNRSVANPRGTTLQDETAGMRRRVQLKVAEEDGCTQMDERMSLLHEAVQQNEPNSRAQAEFQLEIARKRYMALRC